ncbi:hypothetical protein C1H46_036497 [Malus baccata]|uniref:Uncharacterized protein n=1 Tax=Malus baccata TaxID=106549 RepID=A0A540KUQ2_MALBA|nr:hypothetical protein C1H46_036497 [Malus baccata]
MYDVSLRPILLQTLIRDLPDDKHPSGSPLELSKVVYAIKTHNLLCESVQDMTDQKLIITWKSAIDSWVRRLVQLVSSDSQKQPNTSRKKNNMSFLSPHSDLRSLTTISGTDRWCFSQNHMARPET